ncbi:hypothetical protein V8V91_08625 [Algoriphagus halophilus]|uniref:hypothetical protein n=1 Tax=Algoriphagus halophilus TaxID=226505 RepID=UPI00358F1C09
MEKDQLEYLEVAFSLIKEKKADFLFRMHSLIADKIYTETGKVIGPLNGFIFLFHFMESMNLIKLSKKDDGNISLVITMHGLSFKTFEDAYIYHELQNEEKSKFFQLEIKRANWDIRTAKFGWLVAGLAGVFLKDLLILVWDLIK